LRHFADAIVSERLEWHLFEDGFGVPTLERLSDDRLRPRIGTCALRQVIDPQTLKVAFAVAAYILAGRALEVVGAHRRCLPFIPAPQGSKVQALEAGITMGVADAMPAELPGDTGPCVVFVKEA